MPPEVKTNERPQESPTEITKEQADKLATDFVSVLKDASDAWFDRYPDANTDPSFKITPTGVFRVKVEDNSLVMIFTDRGENVRVKYEKQLGGYVLSIYDFFDKPAGGVNKYGPDNYVFSNSREMFQRVSKFLDQVKDKAKTCRADTIKKGTVNKRKVIQGF